METCLTSDSDIFDNHSKVQLMHQIIELQTAVNEMKCAFTGALQQLGNIQCDDQNLCEKINQTKSECQDQIAEVIKLMLSLKAEFGYLKEHVQQIQNTQNSYQFQIQTMLTKQNLLVSELCRTGIISDHIKQQLVSSHSPVERTSSGCQSSDSGVALLLEKAHNAFQSLSPSDQDISSIPESSVAIVPTFVHDYICDRQQTGYDSDSSLVTAANKSLSLSTSLSKQCGLELDNFESSSDDGEYLMEDVDPAMSKNSSSYSSSQEAKINNTSRQNNNVITVPQIRPCVQDKQLREGQRLRIMAELLESEKKYCRALWTLQDTFAEPMKEKKILKLRDINTIFPDEIKQLYEKHCMLLHKLEERIQVWKWTDGVGDVMFKFINPEETDALRLYTSYVNDFPEMLKTFHKLCRQSGHFAKFLKSCLQQPNCKNMDLGSFLLAPVQRIPKYILFLKHMQKFTDTDHPDSKSIGIVLSRMNDFLSRLNDSMEHSFQLVTVQMNQHSETNGSMKKLPKVSGKESKSMQELNLEDPSYDIENEMQLYHRALPVDGKRKIHRSPCSKEQEYSRNSFEHDKDLSRANKNLPRCTQCRSSADVTTPTKFSSPKRSSTNFTSTDGIIESRNINYASDDTVDDDCWHIEEMRDRKEKIDGFSKIQSSRDNDEQHCNLSSSSSDSPRLSKLTRSSIDLNSSNDSQHSNLVEVVNLPLHAEYHSMMNEPGMQQMNESREFQAPYHSPGPIRPLSKSHSAHAVHEVVKEQEKSLAKANVWAEEVENAIRKSNVKTANKHEKKKISLRALKGLWFFKRRHNVAVLKTMDLGAYASHDVLFPTNDDKLLPDRQSQ